MVKRVIIILDGLADRPIKKLGNKTPLEAAYTPNLDYMAMHGVTGLMYPIKGIAPESGAAQFVILGYPLSKYPGRGVIEAIGAGIKIKKRNVYLRCNFAFVKGRRIGGRAIVPSKKIFRKLNRVDRDIKIIPTIGYRGIMIVRNGSPNVSNTHPGYIRYKNYSKAVTRSNVERKCHGDKKTCKKINDFVREAKKILKNKTILIRGAGNKIPRLRKLRDWSLVVDMPVEIGLGKLLGMRILKRKNVVGQALKAKSNVYVQVKGPDAPGHLGNFRKKVREIEKIDKMLKPLIKSKDIICITADHATPCKLRRHSKDPVPILIYGKGKDNVGRFSEKACGKGSIGKIEGKDLRKYL